MEFNKLLRVFDSEADAAVIMDQLLHERINAVRQRLIIAMKFRLKQPELSNLVHIFEGLSVRFRARLLTSAEVFELVQIETGDAEEITQSVDGISNEFWYRKVLDCFERERLISDLEAGTEPSFESSDECVWSPLGDYYAKKVRGKWELRTSELIGGVIALDFDSPLSRRREARSGVLSQPRFDLSDEERAIVAEKLSGALQLIDKAIPMYGALIRNFTRRIMIRRSNADGEGVDKISSEHVPRQPGIVRMLNFHAENQSTVKCAESLLHESIHNFIACWETAHGSLLRTTDQYRPVSPWSGNPIPNSSLAHAIFVYYACLRLYERLNKIDASLNADALFVVKDRSNVIVSGFLIGRKLSDQFLTTDVMPESFIESINQVQKLISYWKSHPEMELSQCAA